MKLDANAPVEVVHPPRVLESQLKALQEANDLLVKIRASRKARQKRLDILAKQ